MAQRVVMIGTGLVGASAAYALINQGITEELVLIDLDKNKAHGEAIDLQDAAAFAASYPNVWAGDYEDCGEADIVCITAGKSQLDEKTRMDSLEHIVKMYKTIVGRVMDSGFDGKIIVASNPLDVAAYAAYKFSGLPPERVIGTGTLIDTARYRIELGNYFGVSPKNVNGYVIGEHGPTQVAAISATSIGGRNVSHIVDEDNIKEVESLASAACNRGGAIRSAKGATAYGIAMAIVDVAKVLSKDEDMILPVSVLLSGEYGYQDVYAGTPAIVNSQGVKEVIELPLNQGETEKLDESIQAMKGYLETVSPIIEE